MTRMLMLDNNTWIDREIRDGIFYTLWVKRTEGGMTGWRYVATSKDKEEMERRFENLK